VENPDVTVVICVYNGEPWIGRQLEALSRQECDVSWELVISDNGCTDGTLDVVEQWRRRLPCRVMVADASVRTGICHARNVGALAARGDIIAYCDCDDVVGNLWVQAAYEGCSDSEFACGLVRELVEPFDESAPIVQDGAIKWSRGTAILGCNFSARRKSLFELGGFDEGLPRYGCDDVELSIRALKANMSIGSARNMVVYFRPTSSKLAQIRKVFLSAMAEVALYQRHPDWYARMTPARIFLEPITTPIGLAIGAARGQRLPKRAAIRALIGAIAHPIGWFKYSRSNPVLPLTMPSEDKDAAVGEFQRKRSR